MRGKRPRRLGQIAGIGVDQMGAKADALGSDILRLENLDVDIPPDRVALLQTKATIEEDQANSYLPFVGQTRLRKAVAAHVSKLSGLNYSAERNCLITAGGLSGILNVLLAVIDNGDEVIVSSPFYSGILNRVRLAGGIPRFAHFTFNPGSFWSLNKASLRAAISIRTRAMLLMSPSMPTGAYLDETDWRLITELCVHNNLTLIVDSAMERLLFDHRPLIHPASYAKMAGRTILVGSASKELRLIGWRVGWIIAPEDYLADLTAVCIANTVVPVGIAQDAVAVALEQSPETLPAYVAELEQRRNALVKECAGLSIGVPAGGWSMVLRTSDHGLDGATASARLFDQGIAATAMNGWGDSNASRYIRFVFSNEPVERLQGSGTRIRAALRMA